MENKHRYKLIGGQVVEGYPCDDYSYPNAPIHQVGATRTQGAYFPSLLNWFPSWELEDLFTPFDANGEEIIIGTEIIFIFSGKINRGKVVKIGEPCRRSYWTKTRNLSVEVVVASKKVPVKYPSRCYIATPNHGKGVIINI